jgi:IS30 family transposase
MRDDLWWYLPTHRVARRPRRTRRRRDPKFHRDVSILFRPDDVAHRRQFGHWEGDLMLFKQKLGQTNVTTLVERVSRFTVILKNPNRRTKPVMGKIIKAIKDLPHQARRSITFVVVLSLWTGRTFRLRLGRKHGSVIRPHPSRQIASQSTVRQCVAKRNRREH